MAQITSLSFSARNVVLKVLYIAQTAGAKVQGLLLTQAFCREQCLCPSCGCSLLTSRPSRPAIPALWREGCGLSTQENSRVYG